MTALVLAAALSVAQTAPAESAPPPTPADAPARVLIVTGQDIPVHEWVRTAPAVRALLEADGRLVARIVEDPEVLATDLIDDYDALVLHFQNDAPLRRDAAARANLERYVRDGGGLVLLHFACGAFRDWPGFVDLAGRVWDGVNTHDPRGPFAVRIVGPDHPISRGLADFDADDELYIGLVGPAPVEVLAVAKSKLTGADHPMAFVLERGRGRVFHTPLGHDVKAFEMPGVAELIRRGTRWAAGRQP